MAIGLIFKHHRSEGKRKKKRKNTSGLVYFSLAACKVGMIRNLKKERQEKKEKGEKKRVNSILLPTQKKSISQYCTPPLPTS